MKLGAWAKGAMVGCALLALAFPRSALAGAVSFTGTFTTDDQVQFFDLSLANDSTVTFQSLGYGGGANSANAVIPPGGFDSFFTWFDGEGNQIGTNDNGCGTASSNNGACLDAYAQVFLAAGNYILALTESGNEPIGSVSQGFTEQGQGNFTCPQGFCDTFDNQDNGNWAVDISGVTSATESAAPEPATLALIFSGLLPLTLAGRRRTHSSRN